MSSDTSTSRVQDVGIIRQRQHSLCVALGIACVANVLIPTVLFSATQFFGLTEPRDRVFVAIAVLAEYLIAFLFLLLHANVGFAGGYTFATAATVTLGSVALVVITLVGVSWDWSAIWGEVLVVGGFAFAVMSNGIFLSASFRYARAIHPRLHAGGLALGVAAFIALVVFYIRIVA